MPSTLLIRADASPQIGTGHVMRCLSLAQGFIARAGRVLFVCIPDARPLEARIKAVGAQVEWLSAERGSPEDALEMIMMAEKAKASALVLDGYCFEDRYQQTIADAGLPFLVVDDYGHAKHYSADLILNQNLGASEDLYSDRAESTKLLLGPSFALLRPEFMEASKNDHEISAVAKKILVTLGGADPDNHTCTVLDVLSQVGRSDLDVTVLVGGENPHGKEIEKRAKTSGFSITVLRDVPNMAELMAATDIAIAAAGSTTWELLCMGVPTVTGVIAENQEVIADALKREDLAIVVGWYKDVSDAMLAGFIAQLLSSRDLRALLSAHGKSVVDGRGVSRVLDALESVSA